MQRPEINASLQLSSGTGGGENIRIHNFHFSATVTKIGAKQYEVTATYYPRGNKIRDTKEHLIRKELYRSQNDAIEAIRQVVTQKVDSVKLKESEIA